MWNEGWFLGSLCRSGQQNLTEHRRLLHAFFPPGGPWLPARMYSLLEEVSEEALWGVTPRTVEKPWLQQRTLVLSPRRSQDIIVDKQ